MIYDILEDFLPLFFILLVIVGIFMIGNHFQTENEIKKEIITQKEHAIYDKCVVFENKYYCEVE